MINGNQASKVKKIANIISSSNSKELQITSKNLGSTPKEFTSIKHHHQVTTAGGANSD